MCVARLYREGSLSGAGPVKFCRSRGWNNTYDVRADPFFAGTNIYTRMDPRPDDLNAVVRWARRHRAALAAAWDAAPAATVAGTAVAVVLALHNMDRSM